MKRNEVKMFVIGLIGLAVVGTSAFCGDEKVSFDWKEFARQVKNPTEKIFDHWAVVEAVPLVKKTKDVPAEFASAASVLLYLNSFDRFSKGDEMVFNALLNHFGKLGKNSDFIDRLYKSYHSYLAMLDKDENYNSELSGGQEFSSLLLKKSKNVEIAVFAYLNEHFYLPTIRVGITQDTAKTLLDCGIPFVLIKDGKSFVCLGYAEKNGKTSFIVADTEEVEQKIKNRADSPSVQGEGEAAKKAREFCASMDKQDGPLKTDIKFIVSDEQVKGIKFIEINGTCAGVVICKLIVDECRIKEFIESHKKEIDDIIIFSEDKKDNKKSEEKKEAK